MKKKKSWRTTTAGAAAIGTAITMVVNDPNNWKAALPLFIVGVIGLLAKDHNVTGTGK